MAKDFTPPAPFFFRGRGGAEVELLPKFNRRGHAYRWSLRFVTTQLVFSGFRSKLDALIFAAFKCRRSAKAMEWEPVA